MVLLVARDVREMATRSLTWSPGLRCLLWIAYQAVVGLCSTSEIVHLVGKGKMRASSRLAQACRRRPLGQR
jgi:hypothetical protein